MVHLVPWTKTLLEDFIKEGLLTEDEEFVIRTRVANYSQVKQALELGVSTSTISKIVIRLKEKYDELHNQYPDRFPERVENKSVIIKSNTDIGDKRIIIL